MEILMTGRLSSMTSATCDIIAQRHKLVMVSDDVDNGLIGKAATPFKISPHEKDFEKVFHSYHFDAAVFCAQHPEEPHEYFDEFQDLEACLRLCSDHDVNQVVYLSSTAVYAGESVIDESTPIVPKDCVGVMLAACERLCDFYRTQKAMSVIILHIPCLYGYGESASIVGNAIAQAMDKAAIRFLGSQNQLCSFLSQKDLGELLVRVIDSWTTQYPVINIPGASSVTLGELGDAIKLEFPTVRLSYTEQVLPIATPVVSQIARQEYDWVPVHTLEEDMPELIKSLKGETISEEPTIRDRVGRFLKEHSFIVRLIELFLGFILMEFLNYITGTSIQFQNVDFRLLYVVLLGTLHGVKTGFSAAALACVSLIIAYINSGSAWYIIAYNVDSWLPFICYFVLGTITGYVKDRLRNDNKFLSEEKAILEDKYVLLNEFYVSAIQNKGQYKTQIMNYRDSFGRIFDVTRKLDHTVAEEVINEALHALEDILENQSICIYTCDNNMLFGRLIACSKKISGITEKSLVLSKLNDMVDAFVDGEVWSNKERLGGYPEYATPIFREDRLVALIIIQKVRYEQMAIYYENLIKIMCGLVKISLLRALEYTEKIEDEMYLEGTHVLLPEYFKDILRVKEEMVEDGVSEYTLLHFSTTEDNVRQTAQMLEKTIRTTDLLGLGSDGELYICLSQTNESNISFVLQRIKDSGLAFQQLENSEA